MIYFSLLVPIIRKSIKNKVPWSKDLLIGAAIPQCHRKVGVNQKQQFIPILPYSHFFFSFFFFLIKKKNNKSKTNQNETDNLEFQRPPLSLSTPPSPLSFSYESYTDNIYTPTTIHFSTFWFLLVFHCIWKIYGCWM